MDPEQIKKGRLAKARLMQLVLENEEKLKKMES